MQNTPASRHATGGNNNFRPSVAIDPLRILNGMGKLRHGDHPFYIILTKVQLGSKFPVDFCRAVLHGTVNVYRHMRNLFFFVQLVQEIQKSLRTSNCKRGDQD